MSRIVRKRKDLRGSTQRPCCEEVPEDGGARHESPDDIRAEIPACVWFRNCARRIPVHCCRPLTEVRAGNLLPRGPVWSSTVVLVVFLEIFTTHFFEPEVRVGFFNQVSLAFTFPALVLGFAPTVLWPEGRRDRDRARWMFLWQSVSQPLFSSSCEGSQSVRRPVGGNFATCEFVNSN